ncbi:MAG: PAAR domain-containing protein [Acidiphilium sp.]|jgi:uncharacterized Zn-binding protein involved in type VI secretion|nr:MAG: hypothetical protein B7Z67_09040 [Acidiphilium sp. 21-60-14]OZB39422.1 MAG: hypothetical protein B7X48_08910 [Acidiphilium sp. 34-60-192]HQT88250.1 PAAR domain-containing protein [Acidiphilium sp.]HQU23456.1 PAAR domain-containing protein [Acidiphilium sp.]
MAGEKPAARITDLHTCPAADGPVPHVGGPIILGSPNVLIGGLPAARVSDTVTCVGPPDTIVMGSPTVLINGLQAARMGDQTAHGGVIALGCPTVLIGTGSAASMGELGSAGDGAAQAAVLTEAAALGKPFCAICHAG